jgi:dienelactone hydrolase
MLHHFAAFFVFCLIAVPLPGHQQAESAAEDELIIKALAFIDALSREDFEAAARDFDETMIKVSGPDKLAEFWKQVPERLGAFRQRTAARRDRLGEYEVALVTCKFEKVTLDARVVFDKDGKIGGFQFIPSLPPAEYMPPAYADPSKFGEHEIKVGEGGDWPLPGTLTIPKREGPFSAVVLVHGSGPNDRDETIGPNKPFQDLAWGLASKGVAVLRYEKRTRMYGPRLVADPKFATMTVKEETIDDAVASVLKLRAEKDIDRNRVFVLGHSLGGMLIPRIALAGKDLDIAGFIVMAGLTNPLPETFLRQMTYLLSLDGETSAEDRKQLDEIKKDVGRINALQDSDAGKTGKILNATASYWLDLRGYYPPVVALKADRPMLILQGSRDYQVTTEDFENWKKELGGRPGVEFKLYPKLNHLFAEGQGLPTPNEYSLIHGSVAESVIDDIAAFVQKH